MKIYLAGKMRGIHAYNHPAFDAAAALLRAEGHEVFSPAEHDRATYPDLDWPNMTGDPERDGIVTGDLNNIIKGDLIWICDNAEQIAVLPGAEHSKGVKVERALAEFLSLSIREL